MTAPDSVTTDIAAVLTEQEQESLDATDDQHDYPTETDDGLIMRCRCGATPPSHLLGQQVDEALWLWRHRRAERFVAVERILAARLAEREGVTAHEFTEDVNDGSMCVCGIPALTHDAVERGRGEVYLCSQCGEQPSAMLKIGTDDGWCITCLDEAADCPTCSERGGEVGALAEVLSGITTHNGQPLSPKNLRWAATHEALCRSFIFDVLMGLADALEAAPAQQPPDPLAEGVLALAAEWDAEADDLWARQVREHRSRDAARLRALLSAREQQTDEATR